MKMTVINFSDAVQSIQVIDDGLNFTSLKHTERPTCISTEDHLKVVAAL